MKKIQTPSTITASTTDKSRPLARLQLYTEKFAGRKVIFVVADVKSDEQHDCFADMARMCLPGAILSPISWPDFLKALPTIEADIVFMCSTEYAPGDFSALRNGLEQFRSGNPKAVVAMANLPRTHGTMSSLMSARLIDHVDHHDIFSIPFLLEGVERFARRQELQ